VKTFARLLLAIAPAALIRSDRERWGPVVKSRGLKIQ